MKILKTVFLFSMLLMVSFSSEAGKKKKKEAVVEKKPVISFDGIEKFKYTTEQIEGLLKTTEYKKAQYDFSAAFYSLGLSKIKMLNLKKKCDKNGETPFRICVSVYETKESRGKKKKEKYTKGYAEIYILDMENKKLVEYDKESLKKLCPS